MRFTLILALTLALKISVFAQDQLEPDISRFTQVVVSEGIDLVLEQGNSPDLRLSYVGVDPNDIIVRNRGNKLKIYLEGCQNGCKEGVAKSYRNAKVIAYVTFTTLTKLIVKGDNEVISQSPIKAEKFVLRSFGDNNITPRAVNAYRWKTAFYGDSDLSVEDGAVTILKVKTYGDNVVNLRPVTSSISKVHSLGDNNVRLQADNRLNLTVLGDATIEYDGNPSVGKRLVLGDLSLNSY